MNPLTTTRRQTSRALSGLELPDAFAVATVAAEAKVLATKPARRTRGQKNDLRRLADKARRVEVAS